MRATELSELFDVLIINLPNESVRRASSIHEVQKLGFEYTIVTAEDGADAVHQENGFLRSGASACFASHVKAWEIAAEGKKPYSLIVEDDLRILNIRRCIKILCDLPASSLDIAQLGFLSTGFRQFVDIKLQNIEIRIFLLANILLGGRFIDKLRVYRNLKLPKGLLADDFRPGAHFYVLTSDAARRLLTVANQPAITLDAYLMALSWHQAFKVARVKKSLVGQRNFPSRIKLS